MSSQQAPRDTSRPVMLVGFQHQGNLGLGYLAAVLERHGYHVLLCDIEKDPDEVLEAARSLDPMLIGFSLIFQFYIRRYEMLADHLRRHGIGCHFTMGGHFPSLSSQNTMALVPQLDSVVRFEGELTLLELADRLSVGGDWRDTPGIAYWEDGVVVTTPMRPLVADLDSLPYPRRDYEPETILGRRAMPLLASRGCARTCSFCSIHTFYRTAPGKVVRTRKPREVVAEMKLLNDERGISIFLFQDDDFPLYGPVWQRWAHEFLDELYRAGLPGRAIWKINCRADVVDTRLFAEMRDAGLYLVYMGLESGTDEGLSVLNKGITVQQNLRAVTILKELGVRFEFGFMMFDPSSSFASVLANVSFLREIVGDGTAAAIFCRMLPYDGTPIKSMLEQSGRLRGDVCNPDYDFLDPRLDQFYQEINRLVHVTGWIHGYRALSPQLNWAWNEVAVLHGLFPALEGMGEYQRTLQTITKDSNALLLETVETLSYVHSEGRASVVSAEELESRCAGFLGSLQESRDRFVAANGPALLSALDRELALVPA